MANNSTSTVLRGGIAIKAGFEDDEMKRLGLSVVELCCAYRPEDFVVREDSPEIFEVWTCETCERHNFEPDMCCSGCGEYRKITVL